MLDRLNEHYPEPPIPLDHSDAFTLLIAVLLSAQCTDKKVNEVTPALSAGPTPDAMAALGEDASLAISASSDWPKPKRATCTNWRTILVNVHGSQVPSSFEELEHCRSGTQNRQRGDGSGLGVPAFPVDTHIHRLAQRWG